MDTIRLFVDPGVPGAALAAEAAADVASARGVRVTIDDADPWPAAAALALAAGERSLGVAGNDRSFRLLVEAVAYAGLTAGEVVVAIVPADPTCDLVKTFGLPTDPAQMGKHLSGDNDYPLDLLRVTCAGGQGQEHTAVFAQLSEAGWGATLAKGAGDRAGADRRRGRFRAFWCSVLRWRTPELVVKADRKIWKGAAANVVVGNCIFFHDGLRVSPRSYPGDGVVDVLVQQLSRGDVITLLPKMFRGEHLPHPRIQELRVKIGVSVEHAAGTRPLPVHADGEQVGVTPARYVILPGAVRLKL